MFYFLDYVLLNFIIILHKFGLRFFGSKFGVKLYGNSWGRFGLIWRHHRNGYFLLFVNNFHLVFLISFEARQLEDFRRLEAKTVHDAVPLDMQQLFFNALEKSMIIFLFLLSFNLTGQRWLKSTILYIFKVWIFKLTLHPLKHRLQILGPRYCQQQLLGMACHNFFTATYNDVRCRRHFN